MRANQTRPQVQQFFEVERVYPDETARTLYENLIGLDEHKKRLLVELEMLLYPQRLAVWSRKHHQGRVLHLCEQLRNRTPLILLEGDVGTGKTALAETIGDALARQIGSKAKVHLLKINSQVRGTGLVGEMSDLIVQAFAQAEARAASLKEPMLLLLDEADALAARRDTQQMHHEDKAGLNTLLQRLDNLRLTGLAIAVIFITNRPDALDPAIRRRAALALFFERPADEVRADIIRRYLPELEWTEEQIAKLVHLTGSQEPKNKGISFTASDLTNRLFMGALREAFSQQRELKVEDLLQQAGHLMPTPKMGTI
jgi:AAA+ superfamily predicted ATPase